MSEIERESDGGKRNTNETKPKINFNEEKSCASHTKCLLQLVEDEEVIKTQVKDRVSE